MPRDYEGNEPPATPRQLRYIALLSRELGMREPTIKTMGEAGRMIRHLQTELKGRKISAGQENTMNKIAIFGIVGAIALMAYTSSQRYSGAARWLKDKPDKKPKSKGKGELPYLSRPEAFGGFHQKGKEF